MRLSFRIALRFLSSNKGQTILIAFGIAIGISVQIFIGSLIEGLQFSLVDATIGSAPHITLISKDKALPISNYNELKKSITSNFEEVTIISPNISKGSFLKLDKSTEQILIRGFDFNSANQLYKIDSALIKNGKLPKDNEILLGLDFANENNLSLGDSIEIVTAEGNIYPAKISGFFDLKIASINKSWAITTLNFASNIFSLDENQVSSIELQISTPFEADNIAKEMNLKFRSFDVTIDNWKAQNQQLLSGLDGQSTSSLMIQVFVVISVVLGIASVLAISVVQKSKQLGILKAMGITDGNASLVFLFQGFLLGILGGILGIILGLGLLWSFAKFALDSNGNPIVPLFINYYFIAFSGILAIIASTLASIIPAIKSKNLSPMEVIKNG